MKFFSKIIVTIINSVETCPGRTPKDHMDGNEGGGGGGGIQRRTGNIIQV